VSARTGTGESCDACCPVNFFASPTNAQRWLAAHPDVQGRVISLPDAIVAGRTVFGDMLKEA
jgi:Alkylmercury lyase